jgi:hypothetical protein
MGYWTDFDGKFEITPPLSESHRAYLQQFASVRHMRWHADRAATLSDPLREDDAPISRRADHQKMDAFVIH